MEDNILTIDLELPQVFGKDLNKPKIYYIIKILKEDLVEKIAEGSNVDNKKEHFELKNVDIIKGGTLVFLLTKTGTTKPNVKIKIQSKDTQITKEFTLDKTNNLIDIEI